MSQSENKSSKSNLLMPLAIGGGLLLLFMNMGKAKAASPSEGDNNEIDTNTETTLPQPLPKASGQSTPQAAPKYTDVVDSEGTASEQVSVQDSAAESSDSESSYASPDATATSPSYDSAESEPSEDGFELPSTNSASKWNAKAAIQQAKQQKMNPSGMRQYADQNKAQSNSATKWNERTASQQAKQQKMNPSSMRRYADPKQAITNSATKWGIRPYADPNKGNGIKPKTSNTLNPLFAQANKLMAQQRTVQAKTNVGNKIFPLKQGQNNNYIKEVQRKLGINPTGFFGGQTRAALLKKYHATFISEALYKQIMTGKVIAKSNPKIVKKAVHRPKR